MKIVRNCDLITCELFEAIQLIQRFPLLRNLNIILQKFQIMRLSKYAKKCLYADNDDYVYQSGSVIALLPFEVIKNIPPYLLNLLENLLILSYQCVRSRNMYDVLVAITTFYKLQVSDSYLSLENLTLHKFKSYVEYLFQSSGETAFVEQSLFDTVDIASVISFSKDKVDLWPKLRTTSLWKNIQRVMVFISAHALYQTKCSEKINAKFVAKVEKELYTNETIFKMDMAHAIMETIILVAEKGYQIFILGDVSSIFHSGKSYEMWMQRANQIIANSKYLCNPKPHGIDLHTFQKDVELLLTQGSDILKMSCDIPKMTVMSIRSIQAQLTNVKAMFINSQCANETRRAPLMVVIEGNPGAGKTAFSDMLHIHYAKVRNKEASFTNRFAHSSRAKYWDGFQSYKWSLLIDDLASENPANTVGTPEGLNDLLGIGNNAPFMPNMADLSEKGKTPFTGELAVITTNSPFMHLHHYFATPAAVARRLKYRVVVSVKEEYQDSNGLLDSNLLNDPLADEYPDWWIIQIRQVVIQPVSPDAHPKDAYNNPYVLRKGPRFDNTVDFILWYNGIIQDHHLIQDKIESTNTNMFEVKLCQKCFVPRTNCICRSSLDSDFIMSEQSLVHVVGETATRTLFSILLFVIYTILFEIGFRIAHFLCFLTEKKLWNAVWKIVFRQLGEMWYEFFNSWSLKLWLEQKIEDFSKFDALKNIRLAGRYIERTFKPPAMLADIVAILIAVVAAYKLYLATQGFFEEQASIEDGSRPTGNERQNVWFNPDYEVSNFDVGRKTSSWRGLTTEEVEKQILKNVVNCKFFYYDEGVRKYAMSSALCLGCQLYVTTDHSIPMDDTIDAKVTLSDAFQLGSSVNITLRQKDILRTGRLAFFHIQKTAPKADITNLLMGSGVKSFKGDATMLGRNIDGSVNRKSVKAVKYTTVSTATKSFLGLAGYASPYTKEGDCGSIYILHTGQGPVIGALHELGRPNTSFCSGVTLDLDEIKQYINLEDIMHSGKPRLKAESAEKELSNLHHKSPVRYIEKGNAIVYGSFLGHRNHMKSRVEKTILSPLMERDGFTTELVAPDMKGWEPIRNNMLKLVTETPPVDKSVLEMAVHSMFTDWQKIDDKELNLITVYDDCTITNGAPGVRFVDAMPRSTSAGEPWNKNKKFFLQKVDIPGFDNAMVFTDEIKKRANDIIECYVSGSRACPVFAGSLKDKAISSEKNIDRKIRMFMGAPVDFTYVMRKYLLSFIRVSQRNKFLFESAPGMEAQSAEWDVLYHYLTKFGTERCVFGDFKAFDTSMPPEFLLAAFDLIIRFHVLAGCSDEHIKIIKGIMYDVCYPYVNVKGDLMQLIGKNPSGHALTVTINSIVNCLYMRYCYIMLRPDNLDHCFDFKDNVHLITYGDDNGMNVSETASWFNHKSISDVLATIGVTYTMADKISDSVPFISIEDASFLKRAFRYEEDVERYVCPLEITSIIGSLMIGERSKFISEKARMCAVVRSANDEFFWHGKDLFFEWHERLKNYILELELTEYMENELPTWNDLVERYKHNSKAYLEDENIQKYEEQCLHVDCGRCEENDIFLYKRISSLKKKFSYMKGVVDFMQYTFLYAAFCFIIFFIYLDYTVHDIVTINWSSINAGCESIVNKTQCRPDNHIYLPRTFQQNCERYIILIASVIVAMWCRNRYISLFLIIAWLLTSIFQDMHTPAFFVLNVALRKLLHDRA